MAEEHEAQVLGLFTRLQESTEGRYPPKAILDHYYQPGIKGIQQWLSRGANNRRLVFVLNADTNDTVVGHIEIQELNNNMAEEDHSYWREAFQPGLQKTYANSTVRLHDLAVIKRLGVDPDWQGRGIGRRLLREAIYIIKYELRKVPALVVLANLSAARGLYDSEGGCLLGEFAEASGEPMRSYLF